MDNDEFPYLERLQERMEERLARRVPAGGTFCGFCYARLRAADQRCPVCGRAVFETGPVSEIPPGVLRAYEAKQRTEARWVHGCAFVGLAVAMTLFLLLVIWGPGLLGHPAVAFAVLIGGGYLLARGLGEFVGGTLGYRRGVARRRQLWTAFMAERDTRSPSRPPSAAAEGGAQGRRQP